MNERISTLYQRAHELQEALRLEAEPLTVNPRNAVPRGSGGGPPVRRDMHPQKGWPAPPGPVSSSAQETADRLLGDLEDQGVRFPGSPGGRKTP